MERVSTDVICASTGIPSVDPDGAATLAVASLATVRTHSKSIRGASVITLHYKATVSSGAPDVDLYLEQGPGAPTIEGSAGDATDGWVTVGNKIADITDENWHALSISAAVLPFLRFRAEGQGANPASCKLALKLGQQTLF